MKKKKSTNETTSENLEQRFAEGKDILDYFETENIVRRLSLDVPAWAIKRLDKEANRRGITRQSLLKTWIIDRLDALDGKKND
ncbi:MAG: CopG family transcriptional regulator [Deltaproteobacteria bacterium]|nr:CopG family transcriptional regulator [Deltaproteobacteria bacterium]MBI3293230.1 CopG family transcriptional regulator [Deltaproteobacteria bacterium]